ncbi:hypothetical protein MPDQ_006625 [Monascus purpureus]|uniref:Uncharacterized protein n=1 Tax=Monascus purpureus TaxID=5098 RepID=A0A507R6D8_MONPU|nr:hypothetical protein MPDQ_006625 [Monascus purpureus]
MSSPDLDLDITSVPRSREENQERAFIAASRRKDRSLDARLESANRASMLHKQRTGKALHITKEIVENEAMYEEIDERYQEKRIRMLQAQNLQIEEQFRRHLLAAFAGNNPFVHNNTTNNSSIHARRASAMPLRSTVHNNGVKKSSIDLSNRRSSIAGPVPAQVDHAYTMPTSPSRHYSLNMQSSSSSPSSYLPSDFCPNLSLTPSPLQSYIAQPEPVWQQQQQQQQQPWSGPNQSYLNSGIYQHLQQQPPPPQFMQQLASNASSQTRQFRDRVGSAPEINVQGLFSTMTPTTHHNRMASEPVPGLQDMNITVSSAANTPKLGTPSTDASDNYTTPVPSTPTSPNVTIATEEASGKESGLMVSNCEGFDPDFDDFSRFALGLGSNIIDTPAEPFFFDDFVSFDDYAMAA